MFFDQLLLPCKFNGSSMRGILFFNFASSEPLKDIFLPALDSLNSDNRKPVSEWHVFQNSTQCQSKTCFKIAHVSEVYTAYAFGLCQ